MGRALLAHLGLFELCNWGRLELVEPNSAYWHKIQLLDSCPERTCHSVTVQYLPAGVLSEDDLDVIQTSRDYEDFVSSLGWGSDVSPQHGNFSGSQTHLQSEPIDPEPQDAPGVSTASVVLPVYANHRSEYVFRVDSLLPDYLRDPHKNDSIRVIWLESRVDLYRAPSKTATASKGPSQARILIHPLQNGLFQLKVWVQQGVFPGPYSSVVLSKRILGGTVREIVQSLHRFFSTQSKNEFTPSEQIQNRKCNIKNMLDQRRRLLPSEPTLEVFYSGMMGPPSSSSAPPSATSTRRSFKGSRIAQSPSSTIQDPEDKNRSRKIISTSLSPSPSPDPADSSGDSTDLQTRPRSGSSRLSTRIPTPVPGSSEKRRRHKDNSSPSPAP